MDMDLNTVANVIADNITSLLINDSVTDYASNPTPDPWKTAKRWSKTCVHIGFYTNVICLPVGIILNLISVIIFVKNKMSRTAVGLHLIFLGLADALECFSAIFMTFWPFGKTVIPGYLYPVAK